MKVVIERKRWIRGRGPRISKLLTSDGKMCCIGFVCEALGVTRSAMRLVEVPETITPSSRIGIPPWLLVEGSELTDGTKTDLYEAFRVNDLIGVESAEREARITEILARNGIEAEFVDGEPSGGEG